MQLFYHALLLAAASAFAPNAARRASLIASSASTETRVDGPSRTLVREHLGLPVIAVIGRPNVGKSTIANRLSGSHNDGAIVHDEPGVTRDRAYQRACAPRRAARRASRRRKRGRDFDPTPTPPTRSLMPARLPGGSWQNKDFYVVDTGGLVFDDDPNELFLEDIREQAMLALGEAHAVMLVADGQAGVTAMDERIAKFVRRLGAPVFLMVNKCESPVEGAAQAAPFWRLGVGEPFAVSGMHGTGVAEVLEAMDAVGHLERAALGGDGALESRVSVNVAIIGRPNVGKSSLLNRLIGQERAIVSDIAGTTRDPIDALLERRLPAAAGAAAGAEPATRVYRFIDTAGVRRRNKVGYGSEFFMVNRALKAIRRSDVVLLVLDLSSGILEQDMVLAERVNADGRACVILANKWDLVAKDQRTYLDAERHIRESLTTVRWAEIVLISAKTGKRCLNVYDAVDRAREAHGRRVSTAILNEVIRDALLFQPPPTHSSKGRGKIYYSIQVATEPPTILAFCNNPVLFSPNYRRYLERKLRESLDFVGTPVRLLFRGKRARMV